MHRWFLDVWSMKNDLRVGKRKNKHHLISKVYHLRDKGETYIQVKTVGLQNPSNFNFRARLSGSMYLVFKGNATARRILRFCCSFKTRYVLTVHLVLYVKCWAFCSWQIGRQMFKNKWRHMCCPSLFTPINIVPQSSLLHGDAQDWIQDILCVYNVLCHWATACQPS